MALSFKEKRELQRIVSEKKDQLLSSSIGFRQKREAQKQMADALARLNVKIEEGADSPLLRALLNNEFIDLDPMVFLGKVKAAVDEIEGDIEPVKPAVVSFVDKRTSATVTLEG